jgi:hypothetical protein
LNVPSTTPGAGSVGLVTPRASFEWKPFAPVGVERDAVGDLVVDPILGETMCP